MHFKILTSKKYVENQIKLWKTLRSAKYSVFSLTPVRREDPVGLYL